MATATPVKSWGIAPLTTTALVLDVTCDGTNRRGGRNGQRPLEKGRDPAMSPRPGPTPIEWPAISGEAHGVGCGVAVAEETRKGGRHEKGDIAHLVIRHQKVDIAHLFVI